MKFITPAVSLDEENVWEFKQRMRWPRALSEISEKAYLQTVLTHVITSSVSTFRLFGITEKCNRNTK